jgi:hypothetical protein
VGNQRRLAAPAVLSVLIGGIPHSSMGQHLTTEDRAAAVVRVDAEVAVSADTLQFAEERASAIFSRIGTHLRWIDEETAVREHIAAPFTLVIVNAEHNPGPAARIEEALGFADPRVHRAHVFYDRIDALRARSADSIPSILGNVMAHELGHLLLPPPGHSSHGIMRPDFGLGTKSLETFTEPQRREILSRLRQIR